MNLSDALNAIEGYSTRGTSFEPIVESSLSFLDTFVRERAPAAASPGIAAGTDSLQDASRNDAEPVGISRFVVEIPVQFSSEFLPEYVGYGLVFEC